MTNPFANAIAQAAAQTNMNEATTGGEFTPPAEGLVRLRFVGYIELGKHEKDYKGKKSQVDKVQLLFEASGPKHPPREDGSPIMFSERLTKSLSEKARFYKLFKRMSTGKNVSHFAELLGESYIATVVHNSTGEGDAKKTYANLADKEGVWTVREPFLDTTDVETGEVTRTHVKVAEPTTPIRCFLWDYATQDMWQSIFIDGTWEARFDDAGKETSPARSKNVYQELIKTAQNWVGSPMQEMLFAGGEADIPDVANSTPGEAGSASEDPLEGAG